MSCEVAAIPFQENANYGTLVINERSNINTSSNFYEQVLIKDTFPLDSI